jgi:hypothetical protein
VTGTHRVLALGAAIVASVAGAVGPADAAESPREAAAPSAFSCSLRWSSSVVTQRGVRRALLRITGSCAEGPFAAVLIETPRDRIAPGALAHVDGASRCTRPTQRSLRCTMRSATSHVGARITLREARAQRPRVTFFDSAGRKLPWVSTGGAQSPLGSSAPPPTSGFPQTQLQAEGVFTGGSGGCPVATAFRANFVWHVQGTALRIDQLGTTHTVSGTITSVSANEWSWRASTPSGNERYTNGVIRRNTSGTGFTATADYAFTTTNGCTQTYKVTFTL